MMVCSGCSVRADFRMGSIIRIREEYENERRQRGWCNHDELMIVGYDGTLGAGLRVGVFA